MLDQLPAALHGPARPTVGSDFANLIHHAALPPIPSHQLALLEQREGH